MIIPFSQDIVAMPMEEFSEVVGARSLTESQLSLCRDIRRRGKNKVNTALGKNKVNTARGQSDIGN